MDGEPAMGFGLGMHLEERSRLIGAARPVVDGEFVVCWLHHAVRGHENPVVDAACVLAEGSGLPVLVYQGLGGRHRFNSDRHHWFILEGARDAAAELRARGIRHVFWLPRTEREPSPLRGLVARAAAMVCEDFPAPPFPAWTAAMADRCPGPTIAVDAACVVPMRMMDGEHDRAFRFRDSTKKMFRERATRLWTDAEAPSASADGIDVGFEPVDWSRFDIGSAVAACEIDHGIGPVGHTRGGSVAGYARWEAFRDGSISRYHRRRNAAEIHRDEVAVSRLSAYLHHGHVSPFRIMREAMGLTGGKARDGAEKFIDELWVWRELAHHLCCRRGEEVESVSILPDWARRTLERTASQRGPSMSVERLSRGRSGDRLWDAAQRSLLAHGELHNNLRMTWGKQLAAWEPDAAVALRRLIDLNHRYALDGNDPNSYGGLLWCLGLLDRPFEPGEPPLGEVRGRSTEQHAGRMDVGRYESMVGETSWGGDHRVAVIGAGLAGLAAARTLGDHNVDVMVFDAGRRPGGRITTRRTDAGDFDTGAQYFTVKDPRFARVVRSWRDEGVVALWDGRIGAIGSPGAFEPKAGTARFVGTPSMEAIAAHLGGTLGSSVEMRSGVTVGRVEREGEGWRLVSEGGSDLGVFDAVVIATQPRVAARLAAGVPRLGEAAPGVSMGACWAAMASFPKRLPLDFDGAFVNIGGGPLSWIARDSSKPGRASGERWVLHAGPAWSAKRLDAPAEAVAGELLTAFADAVGGLACEPELLSARRWGSALTEHAFELGHLGEPDAGMYLAGDWCHGGRVEGAYLSGVSAAGRLIGAMVARSPSMRPAAASEQAGLFE